MVRYLSLAPRVSAQSLTGNLNIVPQNFVEVCYCIVFLLLNLTAYRYVIGERSVWLIGPDEEKVSEQACLIIFQVTCYQSVGLSFK
jgi:hypothetical protein